MAAADPAVAAVILQGPPDSGWSTILGYQHLTLGLPYLNWWRIRKDRTARY